MDRAEQAVAYKRTGNCCQAVLLAFGDMLEMDDTRLTQLGKCFGSGMGGMQGTCGALVGAEMVLGLLGGSMPQAKALHDAFTRTCGASICEDLKGIRTGKVLFPCDECVRQAALALEQILNLT